MKPLCIVLLTLITFGGTVSSQVPELAEIQSLNKKVIELSNGGKLDDAIKLSEKIVDLAKKTTEINVAISSANLGILKRRRFVALIDSLATQKEKSSRRDSADALLDDFQDAEALLRKSIKISEKGLVKKDLSGLWKRELAWLLFDYVVSRRLFSNDAQRRIDDSIGLFAGAIKDFDVSIGADAYLTQITVFGLAEIHRFELNLEEAIPLYRRFVESSQRKHPSSPLLVIAHRRLASIFVTVGNDLEAKNEVDAISKLTGAPENTPAPEFDLSRRSKDFKPITITFSLGREGGSMYSGLSGRPSPGFAQSPISRINTEEVLVKVSVDETGKVIDAVGSDKNPKTNRRAEAAVLTWKFRPFVFEGIARKMRGFVVYRTAW